MAKGKRQASAPMSSAGLIRYYETEDKEAIHISPKSVMIACVISAVIVLALNFKFA